ncbi:MAG TPA: DHA2 family efflux MFS transporter permease subunit, partial [Chloroflexota bacterium]
MSTIESQTTQKALLEYKWQAAGVVTIGLFLSMLDNTIVSVALPAMRQDLNTTFQTITWVATAYFLAQAAVIPITGYLSDRQGTKAVFVSALAIFLVGSILCAAATSKEMLIFARVVQGIGGGALMPTSFAIAYKAFPRDEWGRATSAIGVPVLLAPVLGPVIGGLLTSEFGWRAIFAINLPIAGAGVVLALLVLRNRSSELGAAAPVESRFDLIGFGLCVLSFTTLIYGLTEAGLQGWTDPGVDRIFVGGAVLLALLVWTEWVTPNPVLDFRLFLIGPFARANILLWLVAASFYGTLFLIPYFFENVIGTSALSAGEILIGQGVAAAISIAVAGELYNKVGPRALVGVGTACLAAGTIGFTQLS